MMAPFFTTAELAEQLQVNPSSLDSATATLFATLASDIIRDDLAGGGEPQQVDFMANDTITLYGDHSNIIVLPQLPVTAVTSVTLAGLPLQPADYQWRDNGRIYRNVYSGSQFADMQNWIWPFGVPVAVVYSHGYTTIPSALKEVALELAARNYSNPTLVNAQTTGPYSVTYMSRMGKVGMSLSDDQLTRLSAYRNLDM